MKQTKFALLAAVTLAGATLINVAGVQAATVSDKVATKAIPAKATTTAEFTVKAGQLTLDAAPDFHFGDVDTTINNLKNDDLRQTSNTVDNTHHNDGHTQTATPADGTQGNIDKDVNTLQVSDYRGAGSEWTLFAQLGEFKNIDTKSKGTATGVITIGKGVDNLTTTTIGEDAHVIMNTAKTFKNTPEKLGAQTTTADFSATDDKVSSLKLSELKNVVAGTYQAPITWTLMDGAQTTLPTA
ncbi:WxL domain-containing protein [Latilactobacillus sp. 5-91]|uniref:WxL domain-containing protein n=1 Tax=Latilactobacillus sp. 5-91 TaxID=3410924 RepID=UPI003C739199